ncbi:MAG: proline dehydrogenase family protein [Bacteroidetes bacterium]|nr:proline dehydrogenase family protein [Bacteroidota bacterium]
MKLRTQLNESLFKPNDLETAFRYKSDEELSRTRMVYSLIRYPWLVKVFSKLITAALKLKLPVKGLIRQTLFRVFIAGENLEQALKEVSRLQRYQVHVVLDYVAEGEQSDFAYERNLKTILNNVRRIYEQKGHHFISLKLSGLADVNYMTSINDRLDALSRDEQIKWEKLLKRVDDICALASKNGIGVYIDAETYATQFVYDRVAEEMMETYNAVKVNVYNTLQMYLTDRIDYLTNLIEKAEKRGYIPGIKLVRGAYTEYERAHAIAQGKPSPVWSSKEETDASFDKAVAICLDPLKPKHTCLATHNESSILKAIELSHLLTEPERYLKFSQLYGMSDNLSFNLAFAGMDVSKYLPYGEIEKAVPYMLRRAEENTSIGTQTGRELEMIDKEYKRRKSIRHKL